MHASIAVKPAAGFPVLAIVVGLDSDKRYWEREERSLIKFDTEIKSATITHTLNTHSQTTRKEVQEVSGALRNDRSSRSRKNVHPSRRDRVSSGNRVDEVLIKTDQPRKSVWRCNLLGPEPPPRNLPLSMDMTV